MSIGVWVNGDEDTPYLYINPADFDGVGNPPQRMVIRNWVIANSSGQRRWPETCIYLEKRHRGSR